MSIKIFDDSKPWTRERATTLADMIETANHEFDSGYTSRIVYHIATGDRRDTYSIQDDGVSLAVGGRALEVYYDTLSVDTDEEGDLCLMVRKRDVVTGAIVLRLHDVRPWSDTLTGVTVYDEDSKPHTLEDWYTRYIDRQIAIDIERGELEL